MFTLTISPLPAPPRYVLFTISAFAGHSAPFTGCDDGGPCVPQLEPEHWGASIGASEPPESPPPQATSKGAMAKAVATPFDKVCDMPLSPVV
ncbi:hypothetical protein [Burkholderia multivorans]|uniref:hypothetical protein n=1 Tax=Burkholderia multivorans TaxID=87883 RepID=UPI0020B308BA|nr:hypothetical protein [Burkholderia multivorans]